MPNVTIFVFDAGLHSKECYPGQGYTYLQKTKKIIVNLIKRMIFIKPNDEVGIVCYGAPQTNNSLNYENIQIGIPKVSNWKIIKIIEHLCSSQNTGEFEKAIEVACDCIKKLEIENATTCTYKEKTIYFFYNCLEELGERTHDYTKIKNEENADIKMICIGDIPWENLKEKANYDSDVQSFVEFIDEVSEEYWTMDSMITETMFIGPKSVKAIPSNITMQFVDIMIPIAVYKMIEDEIKKPTFRTEQLKTIEYVDDDKTIINKNDIIKANKFGHSLVPITGDDEVKMKFQGGPKSLKILGFINKKEITFDWWGMSPARLVLPSKSCSENQCKDFSSLCETMIRTDNVALVRVVLRNNDNPKVGFLYPRNDTNTGIKSFIFIEMPYEEQCYSQYFKPIPETFEIKPEISSSVDNFIKSSLLKKDENYAFPNHEMMRNPAMQVYWDAIEFKIQHPDKPLNELNISHLEHGLEQPKYIRKSNEEYADKLRQVFNTYVKIEEYSKEKLNNSENEMDTAEASTNKIDKVQHDDKYDLEIDDMDFCNSDF